MIFRVIKKLLAPLSQVIYKAVSQNRARSEAGAPPTKYYETKIFYQRKAAAAAASERHRSRAAGILSLIGRGLKK